MKAKSVAVPVLSVVVILLMLINIYLFKANLAYQSANRQLILQNDSLISVTIDQRLPTP